MEQITRVQIQESIDTYVKTYITDAEWHISLVEDFMHLLTGNSFNITDLQNSRWIRAIINNNKDNENLANLVIKCAIGDCMLDMQVIFNTTSIRLYRWKGTNIILPKMNF